MAQSYTQHLIDLQRHEAKKELNKESLITQFKLLLENADPKTLEFIHCQLSLLESFMEDGE